MKKLLAAAALVLPLTGCVAVPVYESGPPAVGYYYGPPAATFSFGYSHGHGHHHHYRGHRHRY